MLKSNTAQLLSARRGLENVDIIVIDGSAYFWIPSWPASGKIQHYIEKFKYHIGQKLTKADVFLVFDRYQEYSITGATRTSRGTGMIHHLTTATILSAQKVVLTVSENKKQTNKQKKLINIICEELQIDKDFIDSFSHKHTKLITGEGDPVEITRGRVIPRPDISTSHEEADNIIIQQTFMAV